MTRIRRRNQRTWILSLLLIPILMMTLTGIAYSHWPDYIYIVGKITTSSGGGGTGACIEIQKTLSGAFTNPTTGADLSTPTNRIRIGSNSPGGITSGGGIACPPTNFPTKFKLCINVTNCGPTTLTNVIVTDRLEHQFAPINSTPGAPDVTWVYKVDGGSGFMKYYLTWEIGELESGEWAVLCIWIQTTRNPAGFYEPTEACKGYLVNLGATVVADSEVGSLEATTQGIVLQINGYVEPNIALITTVLPYSTPWANDHID